MQQIEEATKRPQQNDHSSKHNHDKMSRIVQQIRPELWEERKYALSDIASQSVRLRLSVCLSIWLYQAIFFADALWTTILYSTYLATFRRND